MSLIWNGKSSVVCVSVLQKVGMIKRNFVDRSKETKNEQELSTTTSGVLLSAMGSPLQQKILK